MHALLNRGVAGVRSPFIADGCQSFRFNRQPEDLLFVGAQSRRQFLILQIFLSNGVICRLDAVLKRKVEARRCLATSGGAHQNQVRFAVVSRASAIVVIQCKIHRVDPALVTAFVIDGVGLTHGVRRR